MFEKSTFALIIPCYNEIAAIPLFNIEIAEFISMFAVKYPEMKLLVQLVDNNSSDNSKVLLHELAATNPECIKVCECRVQGYGASLKYGFHHSPATWYGFADLDNTYPLKDLLIMLEKAQAANLKMISANRLHQKSEMPVTRFIGNCFYSLISKLLFSNSIEDMCSGMRIFNKSCLRQVTAISSNGLRFSIELTAIALLKKWSIAEFSIHYRRRVGESKLSVFKDGPAFLWALLKVRTLKTNL